MTVSLANLLSQIAHRTPGTGVNVIADGGADEFDAAQASEMGDVNIFAGDLSSLLNEVSENDGDESDDDGDDASSDSSSDSSTSSETTRLTTGEISDILGDNYAAKMARDLIDAAQNGELTLDEVVDADGDITLGQIEELRAAIDEDDASTGLTADDVSSIIGDDVSAEDAQELIDRAEDGRITRGDLNDVLGRDRADDVSPNDIRDLNEARGSDADDSPSDSSGSDGRLSRDEITDRLNGVSDLDISDDEADAISDAAEDGDLTRKELRDALGKDKAGDVSPNDLKSLRDSIDGMLTADEIQEILGNDVTADEAKDLMERAEDGKLDRKDLKDVLGKDKAGDVTPNELKALNEARKSGDEDGGDDMKLTEGEISDVLGDDVSADMASALQAAAESDGLSLDELIAAGGGDVSLGDLEKLRAAI